MILAISGSRSLDLEADDLQRLIEQHVRVRVGDISAIYHGACPTGADFAAHLLARKHGIEENPMPAEWEKYGMSAGPRRNGVMLHKVSAMHGSLFAILDGKRYRKNESRGTVDAIRKALALKIPLFVATVNR